MNTRIAIAACAALALTPAGQASAAPDPIAAAIEADYTQHLAALFDHFHRNPELSFLEVQTAKRMAAELKAAGAEVTANVGGTGVIGMIRNGPGPMVMMRADMDGLPVEEKSGLANASRVTQAGQDGKTYPVMHACGHDTHITALVGTARWLMANRDKWSGTVMLLVQPAEERLGGAKAMLGDGIYTRFGKPDYALAFHVAAELPTGTVSAAEGIQYSSSDAVDVMVPGIGGHGASPHKTRDPVYIAAQIVTALQSIDSREIGPLSPVVVTVGSFHSGTKHNIISDRADLQLTVRANDEAVRAQALDAIRRITANIGRAHGLPEDKLPVVTVREGTPVTRNDAALARRLNTALAAALPAGSVTPFQQTGMGAEDFAFFVAQEHGVPGYYFAVGGTPQAAFDAEKAGGPAVPSHHSPLFKVDAQAAIETGTRATIAAIMELLPRR